MADTETTKHPGAMQPEPEDVRGQDVLANTVIIAARGLNRRGFLGRVGKIGLVSAAYASGVIGVFGASATTAYACYYCPGCTGYCSSPECGDCWQTAINQQDGTFYNFRCIWACDMAGYTTCLCVAPNGYYWSCACNVYDCAP